MIVAHPRDLGLPSASTAGQHKIDLNHGHCSNSRPLGIVGVVAAHALALRIDRYTHSAEYAVVFE